VANKKNKLLLNHLIYEYSVSTWHCSEQLPFPQFVHRRCVSRVLLLLLQWNQNHTTLPEMLAARPCGHCTFLQKISSCSSRKPAFVMAVLARKKDPCNMTKQVCLPLNSTSVSYVTVNVDSVCIFEVLEALLMWAKII